MRDINTIVSTCDDVVWWMRQRTQDLGLRCWFQPSVRLQRKGVPGRADGDAVIRLGDSLHCDFGLHYLGLATDTQQQAYVLHHGEQDAPAGLRAALATCNRLQDILAAQMIAGRTGNEVLAASLAQAKAESIDVVIYTHPIGVHGHAAASYIGMSDNQIKVPGTGEYRLFDDTCYSFELNITQHMPEWDQAVRIALETDVAFSDGQIHYLGGRQTRLHLIQ